MNNVISEVQLNHVSVIWVNLTPSLNVFVMSDSDETKYFYRSLLSFFLKAEGWVWYLSDCAQMLSMNQKLYLTRISVAILN